MKYITFYLALLIIVFCGFQSYSQYKLEVGTAKVIEEIWGESNGKTIKLFTLTNINGMTIKVTNFGATLTSVSVPNKNGVFQNVVIGYDSLQNYLVDRGQHGRTIGRFANRIGGAQFNLNGKTYKLTPNNAINSLHGGPNGFSSQVFEIERTYTTADSSVVSLHYTSADMEEGFPGKLTLYLKYILTAKNEVILEYTAKTDKPTVVNFTNHSYFNLTGTESPILDNKVKIFADSITELGPDRLPTGKLIPVSGTKFDFNNEVPLKEKMETSGRGYDMNFVLRKKRDDLALAAEVTEPLSGRLLMAYTTEPGMQLFTTNNAICLEMQHFPDSPNKPQFPNVVLNPGEIYRQVSIYKFSLIQP